MTRPAAASKPDSCRLKPGTERNQTSVVGTLALTGSSYGETEPKKQILSGATKPDFTGAQYPPHILNSGKSPGIQWLNWLHLTERTINRGKE